MDWEGRGRGNGHKQITQMNLQTVVNPPIISKRNKSGEGGVSTKNMFNARFVLERNVDGFEKRERLGDRER
jgi:hypothetical protein